MSQWFENRVAALGTMHGKERAIAPPLKSHLNLDLIVPDSFDTDEFGTFTREVKRPDTQLKTARLKAIKAMEVSGCDIGMASEGSFYPHPALPLLSCDREIVLLIDRRHGLEIMGECVSTDTNHHHRKITSIDSALEFAREVGFPAQGLVVMLRPDSMKGEDIFKGITREDELIQIVGEGLERSPDKSVHMETDLRAMLNPTRMKVIEAATLDLVRKLTYLCPRCERPGFEARERIEGLPCGLCYTPTDLLKLEVYICSHCGHREEHPGKQSYADPMYCPYCNP